MQVNKVLVAALSLAIGVLQGVALFLLMSINDHLSSIDVQLAQNTITIATLQVESAHDRKNMQRFWSDLEKLREAKK